MGTPRCNLLSALPAPVVDHLLATRLTQEMCVEAVFGDKVPMTVTSTVTFSAPPDHLQPGATLLDLGILSPKFDFFVQPTAVASF
jgi:hypothetical protein